MNTGTSGPMIMPETAIQPWGTRKEETPEPKRRARPFGFLNKPFGPTGTLGAGLGLLLAEAFNRNPRTSPIQSFRAAKAAGDQTRARAEYQQSLLDSREQAAADQNAIRMLQLGQMGDKIKSADFKTRVASGLKRFQDFGLPASESFMNWASDPENNAYPDLSALTPVPGSPAHRRMTQDAYQAGPQTGRTEAQTANTRSLITYRDEVQTPTGLARIDQIRSQIDVNKARVPLIFEQMKATAAKVPLTNAQTLLALGRNKRDNILLPYNIGVKKAQASLINSTPGYRSALLNLGTRRVNNDEALLPFNAASKLGLAPVEGTTLSDVAAQIGQGGPTGTGTVLAPGVKTTTPTIALVPKAKATTGNKPPLYQGIPSSTADSMIMLGISPDVPAERAVKHLQWIIGKRMWKQKADSNGKTTFARSQDPDLNRWETESTAALNAEYAPKPAGKAEGVKTVGGMMKSLTGGTQSAKPNAPKVKTVPKPVVPGSARKKGNTSPSIDQFWR